MPLTCVEDTQNTAAGLGVGLGQQGQTRTLAVPGTASLLPEAIKDLGSLQAWVQAPGS